MRFKLLRQGLVGDSDRRLELSRRILPSLEFSRSFVLSYANWKSPLTKMPIVKNLIERSLLRSTAKIVEQDSSAVESLYPRQKPKIRLPKEEIMTYVEELYHQWE